MKNKKAILAITLSMIIASTLVISFNTSVEAEGTIYIRADGSIDPPTAPIQRDGDVYTFTGNIYDSIVVERNNTIIDGAGYTLQGTGSGTGIHCFALTGLTVKNTEIKAFEFGIWLYQSSSNTISGNTFADNGNKDGGAGVRVDRASFNVVLGNIITRGGSGIVVFGSFNSISGNNITKSERSGVYLQDSFNNTICGNNISETRWGVLLYPTSNDNTICGNNLTNNSVDGIFLWDSSGNSLIENNITSSFYGVKLSLSNNNLIFRNNVKNSIYGVYLGYGAYPESSYNNITGNDITNNYHGIKLWNFSNYNSISGNYIAYNEMGIEIVNASDNSIFHNNFIDNTNQTYIDPEYPSLNTWDDGYPSGGNYWSDHNPPDENMDKIGDIPYTIDEDNQDNYPLIYPYGWVPSPDVNSDGIVDIFDVRLLAMAFGSYTGHPDWNPRTDVKQDGVVDIFDVVIIARYFGGPPP